MNDKEFIKSLIEDIDIDDETSSFLLKYLSAWMSNTGIDINADTIKLINSNKDIIDKLKLIYSKEKIIDYTERKIILSEIAKGEKKIEQPKITKFGIEYVINEPTFGERIQAINALNALDAIDTLDASDRIIIIDNITEENAVYEKEDEDDE
jgi:hypothetical protein